MASHFRKSANTYLSSFHAVSIILVAVSIASYTVSFFLPAFESVDGYLKVTETHNGYDAFIASMSSFVNDQSSARVPPIVVWFANVMYWCGLIWFFWRVNFLTLIAGCTSVVLASLYLTEPLMSGYYLWTASMYLFFLAALADVRGVPSQVSAWFSRFRPKTEKRHS